MLSLFSLKSVGGKGKRAEKFATLKFRKNLAIGMKWLLRWYWNKNKTRRKPKTRQDAR